VHQGLDYKPFYDNNNSDVFEARRSVIARHFCLSLWRAGASLQSISLRTPLIRSLLVHIVDYWVILYLCRLMTSLWDVT